MKHTEPPSLNELLAGFITAIAAKQRLYLALQLCAHIALWAWFFFATSGLTAFVVDEQFNARAIGFSVLAMVLFIGFKGLALALRQHLSAKVSEHFYQQFFSELEQKRWALIRSKPTTAWQDVSFRHLPAIEQYLIDYRTQVHLVGIIPLFVLLLVWPLSWLVGLTLLLTLPLIPFFMWIVGSGTASAKRKHITALNRLGSVFADRIKGQRTVRVFNDQSKQLDYFERTSKAHNRRLAEVLRLAFLSTSVLDFFSTVSMALIAVFIGFALLEEVSIGFYGAVPSLQTGLFLLLLAPAFFAEFKALGKLYHVKAEAIASADFWQHTLQWSSAEQTHAPTTHSINCLSIDQGSVYGFEQGQSLLTIPQLSLAKGERVHLTGVSGAGKTLLLDTLAGLRVLEGQLTLNNQPVTQFNELLAQVFYLSQRPVIFSGSLRENLTLRRANDQTAIKALDSVQLSSWYSTLAQGLDTIIDEDINLSGGQQQKLALARVLIFKPELILFDEPFTHLTIAEQLELETIMARVCQQRLSVWVSHRPMKTVEFSRHWHIDEAGLVTQYEGSKP